MAKKRGLRKQKAAKQQQEEETETRHEAIAADEADAEAAQREGDAAEEGKDEEVKAEAGEVSSEDDVEEEEEEEVKQESGEVGGDEVVVEEAEAGGGGGEAATAEEEEEKEVSFDELGLDEQLKRALRKKGIAKATQIQSKAIPLILEGKDVVAQAKTGSGKTYAYLLPLLHELLKLSSEGRVGKPAPNAFILVPTRELCQQVYNEASSLLEFCTAKLKAVQVTASMPHKDMTVALSGPPNIVVTTPACVSTCISKGTLHGSSIKDSLSMLILDEADLLLSYRCEDDLKALVPHLPRSCQTILMSATSSSDVEKLTKLLLHNPVILNLTEVGRAKDDLIPRNVQQFWISCSANDKILYILALLKFELIQKKVLIFVNSIDMAFRLRLFLEKFGIKSAVLNAELPQNSRLHILEAFNAGLFDYLIATDDKKSKEKQAKEENRAQSHKSRKRFQQSLDAEFGVVRGIDFKNVFTVVNFDMPPNPAGYVHRIGRTGRVHNTGASVSLVSPPEEGIFEEIKLMLQDVDKKDISDYISPFPLLTKNAVESLRYRAQDVARSVTTRDIQEARRQDIKNEILNSEKLKAHFEENPRDLDLLKHDKILSSKDIPAHLRQIPEYLIDPMTKEASKIVKLSRAAMGIDRSRRRKPSRFTGGSGRSNDPLRTFSAEGKKSRRRGRKESDDATDGRKRRKQREEI